MTYIALAEAVAFAVVALALISVIRSQQRSGARERDLILNQLLHATGNTWTPPPTEPREPPVELELLPQRYQSAPEQHVA